ncbi:putative Serine phosphatase [Candidatus Zixiibacteriota bacterium]|nr:putative Serine phosphatase [candidate division Zixibacteria bacterium]
MFKIVGTSNFKRYSLDLKPGKYRIGRGLECDFVIPEITVSKNHASIECKEGAPTFLLTDLGSHNGTYLNGSKITDPVEVKSGDGISLGGVEFRVFDSEKSPVEKTSGSDISQKTDSTLYKSMVLPLQEALKPLPSRMSERPDIMPAIFEMAKMLVLPGPKEEILDRSLQLVAKVIPAERMAILLKDESELGVSLASSFTKAGSELGSFSLSRTIITDILSNKNSLVINDIQQMPRFAQQQSIVDLGMKSAMAVPLFDEGEILGILYTDTRNPIHRFNDDSLRLLATFGNLIASRLLNYSLLEERQHRRLLEAELERASSIQASLLPAELPAFPGYQISAYQKQCLQVGGDFYDAALLPDGKMVFLIGDVSGKGLGAALLMSDIISSFRALYYDPNFDLTRTVDIVSRELCRHSAQDNYATLFIGTIDPKKHLLEYVNAGHNPPLFLHSGKIEHLQASGIMVGAFEGIPWEKREIEMHDGDIVLIYTDGVTEARCVEELYGEDRLETLAGELFHLSADETTKAVRDNINHYIKDTPLTDDITIMALKMTARD